MTRRQKVIMIGLDAADAGFIERNAAALPNITGIFGRKPLRRLDCEPLSGAVWPTFMAEASPDVHGIYHHIQWDPHKMRLRRTHPKWVGPTIPFWRKFAQAGLSVLSLDVPFLFKGDSLGAIEIANWGSHDLIDKFWCSHPEIERLVSSFARNHPMSFEVPVDKTPAELDRIQTDILRGITLKTEMVCALMDKVDSDLFIVAYGEAHRAGHILWPEFGKNDSAVPACGLLNVYIALDKAVGQIAGHASPDATIVLFALHGMDTNQSQSHLSSEMLKVAISQLPGAQRSSGETFGLVRSLRKSVPAPIQMAIAKAVPKAVRDYVVSRELSGGFRWCETPMISLDGDLCGYWRANIVGREKEGIIAPSDHIVDDIASEFIKFTTLQSIPLVKKIHFPAREWRGERAVLLPDIVAEWDPALTAVDVAAHPCGAKITGHRATGRTGNHRFEGFYALRHGADMPPKLPMPKHIKELGSLARALLGSLVQ